ncbi:hypothetical protein OC844_005760 [Tilletia horrida]|nr:hypothetical protein OC844_005760 [Tilletia horrida]
MRTTLPSPYLVALALALAVGSSSSNAGASASPGPSSVEYGVSRLAARQAQTALYHALSAEASHLQQKHAGKAAHYGPALLKPSIQRRHDRDHDDDHDHDRDDNDGDGDDGTIGEVALYNAGNERYYTVLSIGTPPSLLPVQLDTGSSDFWLSAAHWNGALPSSSSSSSSFAPTGHTLNISYTDGSSVSGPQGTDTVSLGGYVGAKTAVSVGMEVSADAAAPPVAGVLGMGWPALATGKEPPFWQAADADVFSLYLASSPDVDDPDVYGGTLMLGGADPSLYCGELHYVPLLRPAIAWTIPLDGLSVGSTAVPLYPSSKSRRRRRGGRGRGRQDERSSSSGSPRPIAALVDSGTTLISVPSALAEAFYDAVPGSRPLARVPGFYEYPCTTALDVGVHFGGQRYAIPDGVFVKAKNERPGQHVWDVEYCIGSLFGNGSNDTDFMILGDTFLRSVFTVFHGKKEAIGFAPLAPTAPTTGPRFRLLPNATGSKRYVGPGAHGAGAAGTGGGSAGGAGSGTGGTSDGLNVSGAGGVSPSSKSGAAGSVRMIGPVVGAVVAMAVFGLVSPAAAAAAAG